MSQQPPVVNIEFRGWSPYALSKQQQQQVKGSGSKLPSSAPAPKAAHSHQSANGGLFRRSSSPVFVSANKVASSSTSLQNGLPSYNGQDLRYNAPAQNRIPSKSTNSATNGVHLHGLLTALDPDSAYESPNYRHRDQKSHEEVYPPTGEPRLCSIFDEGKLEACVWSPSHRIAKTAEAATCQWVILDEGFGDIERCDKIFTTTESLAKHVLFAHCEPTRQAAYGAPVQLLPCAWGVCKYKRFNVSDLKEHVLEHLRPLAYACPFQECRMSISSHMNSALALDAHIQTYHVNGEALRSLGTPRSLRSIIAKHPLPLMPKRIPHWLVNNQPIGFSLISRRKITEDDVPEPLAPGTVWPWDLVWTELNKLEPPAIPISPSTLVATIIPTQGSPTIHINEIPQAIEVIAEPTPHVQVEIEVPPRQFPQRDYIDLTNDDIEIFPTPSSPKFRQAVDMTKASLAKRKAKRDHRNRLRNLAVDDSSSESYSDDDSNDTMEKDINPEPKRIKLEQNNPYDGNDNRMTR